MENAKMDALKTNAQELFNEAHESLLGAEKVLEKEQKNLANIEEELIDAKSVLNVLNQNKKTSLTQIKEAKANITLAKKNLKEVRSYVKPLGVTEYVAKEIEPIEEMEY